MTQKEEILEAARTIDGLIKVYGFKGKNLEALVRAQFALDKQIPREPINVKSVIWDLKYGECPICGSGLNDEMCFCSECGTRLDWSESKE